MNESDAIVVRIDGEFAYVEVQGMPSFCGNCGEKGRCGKSAAEVRRYAVRNTVAARVGDHVMLSIPEGAIVRAAAFSYLMPLLFLFAGALLAAQWFGSGLPEVGGAALGLVLGLMVLRRVDRRIGCAGEPALAVTLQRLVIPIDKEA